MKKFLSLSLLALLTMSAWAQTPVTALSDANALTDNTEFTFNGDAVVTVCKNGYVFLRDESGYGMIPNVEGTFVNGQVLSQGWNATKTSVNNGWVRYTNAEGLSDSGETNAELAAPIKLTTLPNESMLNAYVVIEKTSASNASSGGFPGLPVRVYTLPDGSTIQRTETLWGIDGEASGGYFNVYGVIVKVSGKLMINHLAIVPYEEPEGLRGDVNGDELIDINDVTLLIDVVLGKDVDYNAYGADCNVEDGDNTVDINDVTALISRVLTGNWED